MDDEDQIIPYVLTCKGVQATELARALRDPPTRDWTASLVGAIHRSAADTGRTPQSVAAALERLLTADYDPAAWSPECEAAQ